MYRYTFALTSGHRGETIHRFDTAYRDVSDTAIHGDTVYRMYHASSAQTDPDLSLSSPRHARDIDGAKAQARPRRGRRAPYRVARRDAGQRSAFRVAPRRPRSAAGAPRRRGPALGAASSRNGSVSIDVSRSDPGGTGSKKGEKDAPRRARLAARRHEGRGWHPLCVKELRTCLRKCMAKAAHKPPCLTRMASLCRTAQGKNAKKPLGSPALERW